MAQPYLDLTLSDEGTSNARPAAKRKRSSVGHSSSGSEHWHPAVRAQVAGARLELPCGEFIDRRGVSAKAIVCLDRLAVLYGTLRVAYSKGYRYLRSQYPPSSPAHPFHRNEFSLPGSSRRMSSGPFVRHIKELEARCRGEPRRGPAFSWFDDDSDLLASAKARHLQYHRRTGPGVAGEEEEEEEEEEMQAALRASRLAEADERAAHEAADLDAALELSRQVY